MDNSLGQTIYNTYMHVNINGLLYGVVDLKSTKNSSLSLTDAMNKENRNDWILVTISRNGK